MKSLEKGRVKVRANLWASESELSNKDYELFLMDLEGGGIKPLMNKDQTEKAGFQKAAFIHAFDNDWGAMTQYKASFSCDGSKIAFSRDVDGNREIFVVNSDGSNLKRLTNNKLHDGFPMWGKCENSEGS